MNSEGFEPPISWAVTRCIIQLCYESITLKWKVTERNARIIKKWKSFCYPYVIYICLNILPMKYVSSFLLTGAVIIGMAQDKGFVKPNIPGELMVDVGLNRWSSMPKGTTRETWSSKSIGFYYTKRKARGSRLSVYYGLGLGLEKIGLGDSLTLVLLDSTTVEPLPFNNRQVNKNKLAITYFDISLEIRFHPKKTQDGEGLFIGVGGMAGLRLNSHTKWKYDEAGENKSQKISGHFDLSAFRYGYQIRLGFRGIHLFYKRYLSDVFDHQIGEVNPQMTTFGINVTGF